MSTPANTLKSIVEPTALIDCFGCSRGHEMRFWYVAGAWIICPACSSPKLTADAIQDARDGGGS